MRVATEWWVLDEGHRANLPHGVAGNARWGLRVLLGGPVGIAWGCACKAGGAAVISLPGQVCRERGSLAG